MAVIALGDTPRYHAERKPADAVAVTYPDGELTWWELERRATRRARMYQSLGVGKDDFVAVALPNGVAFHEVALAIWKLGAAPGIVSAKLPEHEFQAIIDLMRPKLVITATGKGPTGVQCVSVDSDTSGFDDAPIQSQVATFWKAMTSGGSTGRPKIIVDHIPAEVDLEAPVGTMTVGIAPGDVLLNPGPLYHNAPFIFTTQSLAIGCKIVGMARFDAEEALRLIQEHRVNWMAVVPTMMHRIWSLPQAVREKYDLSSLKAVWHMAAPCPPWLKEAWINWLGPERIFELYGGTERNGTTIIRGDEWLAKKGSVGRPVNGKRVQAFREDGAPCEPGEIGEIYFLAPNPEERPSHYIGAEPRRRSDGWESIGDLGYVDEDGFVFLADRRTDLILRGGANIFPAELEAILDAHPGVASSIVVGLPCEEYGQRVHAIVQPKPGQRLDLSDVHNFLAARLVKYKLPESYELAAEPLRDDAGKARRSALRDQRIDWLRDGRTFQERPVEGASA